jgi:KaiC/GvpD/RAD55 family RecA-like ATPase
MSNPDAEYERFEPDDTDDPDFQETYDKKALRTVTLHELQSMAIPERDMLLSPIIPAKGLVMAFARRGIGKTFLGLNIAYAVASGGKFLRWHAPQAKPVLYVDGEMPARALQERVNMLTQNSDNHLPTSDYFRFLALDMQPLGIGLNLSRPEDQQTVEAAMRDAEFIVFDNLSTLVSGGRENDAESWDSMQVWLLRLRRMGKAVLLIHHAGRGENARGTSKRENVLDTVISLKRPENYVPTEGARFEVHLTKVRGVFGDGALPFEAKLESQDGVPVWVTGEILDPLMLQVMELTDANMSVREIARELEMSKSQVHRLQAKGKAQRQAEQEGSK